MNEICLSFAATYKNPYPKGAGHIACAIMCAEADRKQDQKVGPEAQTIYLLPRLTTTATLDTPVYDVEKTQIK